MSIYAATLEESPNVEASERTESATAPVLSGDGTPHSCRVASNTAYAVGMPTARISPSEGNSPPSGEATAHVIAARAIATIKA